MEDIVKLIPFEVKILPTLNNGIEQQEQYERVKDTIWIVVAYLRGTFLLITNGRLMEQIACRHCEVVSTEIGEEKR